MLQATSLAAIILLMVCSSTNAFPQLVPAAQRHGEAAAKAVHHIHRAFKTLKTTFKTLEQNSTTAPQSANCSIAIVAFTATCPGFEMLAGFNYSRAFFNGFCPCFTTVKQLESVYQTMINECDPAFVFALQMTSTVLCTQPAKKDKYCGEDFMNITNATGAIGIDSQNVTSDSSRLALQQALGATLCTECFEQIVAGMYSYTGLLQAYVDSPKCNAECRASAQSNIQTFSSIQMLSYFCAKNDNVQQVKAGDTFCLPWFMYVQKGGSTIAKCNNITTNASACNQTKNDCIFVNGKCYSQQDEAVSGRNGTSIGQTYLTDMCSNTCFSRMMYATINLLAGAFAPSGSNASSEIMDSPSIDQALSALNVMCVSNKNGFCLPQMEESVKPDACEVDSATWGSKNATCSSNCTVGVKTYFDNIGCCLGTMLTMNTGGDNPFPVIEKTCNVTLPAACDMYASAPVPVTTKISGSCLWLNTNGPANTQYLLNETAKSLGLGTLALKGFVVTAANGVSCNATSIHHHFSPQESSTLGLLAKFSIVAQNDATAQRIAASANANTAGITLPAVEKSAAKTSASIQLSGVTNPPKILNTSAPTATPPMVTTLSRTLTFPLSGCGQMQLENIKVTGGNNDSECFLVSSSNLRSNATYCGAFRAGLIVPFCGELRITTVSPSASITVGNASPNYENVWDSVVADSLWFRAGSAYTGQYIGPASVNTATVAAITFELGNRVIFWPSYEWMSYEVTQSFKMDPQSEGGIILGYDTNTGDHVRFHFSKTTQAPSTLRIFQMINNEWSLLFGYENMAINSEDIRFVVVDSSLKLTFKCLAFSTTTYSVNLKVPLKSGGFGYYVGRGVTEFRVPTFWENNITKRSFNVAPSAAKPWKKVNQNEPSNPFGATVSYAANFALSYVDWEAITNIVYTVAPGSFNSVVALGNGYHFVLSHPSYPGRALLHGATVVAQDKWVELQDAHVVRLQLTMHLLQVSVDGIVVFLTSLTNKSFDRELIFYANGENKITRLSISNFADESLTPTSSKCVFLKIAQNSVGGVFPLMVNSFGVVTTATFAPTTNATSGPTFSALFCSSAQYSVVAVPGQPLTVFYGNAIDLTGSAAIKIPWAIPSAVTPVLKVVKPQGDIIVGEDVYGVTNVIRCAVEGVSRSTILSNFGLTLYGLSSGPQKFGRPYVFENGTFTTLETRPKIPQGTYRIECSCQYPSYFTSTLLRVNSTEFAVSAKTTFLGGDVVRTPEKITDVWLKTNPMTLFVAEYSGQTFTPSTITGDVILANMRATLERREHTPGTLSLDSEFSGFNALKALMIRQTLFYKRDNVISRVCVPSNVTSTTTSPTSYTLLDSKNAFAECSSYCISDKTPNVSFSVSPDGKSCSCNVSACLANDVIHSYSLTPTSDGANVMAIFLAPHITYRLESVERISLDMGRIGSVSFLVNPSCSYYAPDASDYRGREGVTSTGDACDVWNQTMISSYPRTGLDDHMRYYCRNPTADPLGAWCPVGSNSERAACNIGKRCEGSDFVPERRTCNASVGASPCASLFGPLPSTTTPFTAPAPNAFLQVDLCAIFGVVQIRIQVPPTTFATTQSLVIEFRREDNAAALHSVAFKVSDFMPWISQRMTVVYLNRTTLPLNIPSYRLIRIRPANATSSLALQRLEIVGSCVKVPTQFGDSPICECDDVYRPTLPPTASPTPIPPMSTPATPTPATPAPGTQRPSSLPESVLLVVVVQGTPQDIDLQHIQIRFSLALGIDVNQITVSVIGVGSVILRVAILRQQLAGVNIFTMDDLLKKLNSDASLNSDIGALSISAQTNAPAPTNATTLPPTPAPLLTLTPQTLPPLPTTSIMPVPSVIASKIPTEDKGLPFWIWIVVAIGGVILIACCCCGMRRSHSSRAKKRDKKRVNEQKKFYARSGDIANGLETKKEDFARNPIQDIPAPGREV